MYVGLCIRVSMYVCNYACMYVSMHTLNKKCIDEKISQVPP